MPGGTIVLATPNVRSPRTGDAANPFHCSEMNYDELHALLGKHFASFQILGIGHARPNKLRALILKSPLYKLGKLLRRGSMVKKLANKTLDLTLVPGDIGKRSRGGDGFDCSVQERMSEQGIDMVKSNRCPEGHRSAKKGSFTAPAQF